MKPMAKAEQSVDLMYSVDGGGLGKEIEANRSSGNIDNRPGQGMMK